MTMVSDTNDVYSNDDAPTFSSIYYGYSEEVRNLIRIRAGLYQENSNFHNSTWNLFRVNILNWKMSNKGWNDVNHKNFQEELADVLNRLLRNGDKDSLRRTRIMSTLMILYEDIENSPFQPIYDIVESGIFLES